MKTIIENRGDFNALMPVDIPLSLQSQTLYKIRAVLYILTFPLSFGKGKYALSAQDIKAVFQTYEVGQSHYQPISLSVEEIDAICYAFAPTFLHSWSDGDGVNHYDFIKAVQMNWEREKTKYPDVQHEH